MGDPKAGLAARGTESASVLISKSPLGRRSVLRGFVGGWLDEELATGVGDELRAGSGSFDADSRGFDFAFFLGVVVCCLSSSFEEEHGSSSSQMPGIFGGREIRLN